MCVVACVDELEKEINLQEMVFKNFLMPLGEKIILGKMKLFFSTGHDLT